MYISFDTIIEISKFIGALGVIVGLAITINKKVDAPKENKKEIKNLKEMHRNDIKEIQKELCVMNYALLATLDGLKQLKCNGNVTKAYDRLEKHLNKQAHEQE